MNSVVVFALKFCFVAACCMAGAAFAESNVYSRPFSTNVSILIFAALLVIANLITIRGKQSESWAVLAFASWMTIPFIDTLNHVMVDQFVRISPSHHKQPSHLLCWLMPFTFLALYTWGGIRSALRDKWGQVALWCLGSISIIFVMAGMRQFISSFDIPTAPLPPSSVPISNAVPPTPRIHTVSGGVSRGVD